MSWESFTSSWKEWNQDHKGGGFQDKIHHMWTTVDHKLKEIKPRSVLPRDGVPISDSLNGGQSDGDTETGS